MCPCPPHGWRPCIHYDFYLMNQSEKKLSKMRMSPRFRCYWTNSARPPRCFSEWTARYPRVLPLLEYQPIGWRRGNGARWWDWCSALRWTIEVSVCWSWRFFSPEDCSAGISAAVAAPAPAGRAFGTSPKRRRWTSAALYGEIPISPSPNKAPTSKSIFDQCINKQIKDSSGILFRML